MTPPLQIVTLREYGGLWWMPRRFPDAQTRRIVRLVVKMIRQDARFQRSCIVPTEICLMCFKRLHSEMHVSKMARYSNQSFLYWPCIWLDLISRYKHSKCGFEGDFSELRGWIEYSREWGEILKGFVIRRRKLKSLEHIMNNSKYRNSQNIVQGNIERRGGLGRRRISRFGKSLKQHQPNNVALLQTKFVLLYNNMMIANIRKRIRRLKRNGNLCKMFVHYRWSLIFSATSTATPKHEFWLNPDSSLVPFR